ncbi:MAG: DUF308 domain-containing protein [Clostridiales bacterium]|nr:DUF308 domain-containing protein [Clostridiales bacterium]
MKLFKENIYNLIMSLAEIVIGILLLIDPVGYTSGILIAGGIVLTAMGVLGAVAHFRLPPEEAVRNHQLAVGLIEISFGLFCVFCPGWFIETFPVLTLLYGVLLLTLGVVKVQWTIDLIRLRRKQWFLALLSGLISIIVAAVLFHNPLESTNLLWIITAIALIVEAVFDIITIFYRSEPATDAGSAAAPNRAASVSDSSDYVELIEEGDKADG